MSDEGNILRALDGESYAKLTELVSISDLRVDGAFFTGSKLSKLAINQKLFSVNRDSIILDPTCGAGDLLTSCANKLKIKNTLEETLIDWGQRLIGRDINPYFIDVTRKRIALLAIYKGAKTSNNKRLALSMFLPNIKTGNALKEINIFANATHIVINPPYYMSKAPDDCRYGRGKINISAVFMERCVEYTKENATVIAILPDVLRSGTRYNKWRALITNCLSVNNIELYGQFDDVADIDVFIMAGNKKNKTKCDAKYIDWGYQDAEFKTIADEFDVHVGPVVPHRDPKLGKWYPYLHARNISPWETIYEINEHRRFKGKTFKPPFVVIRRTSRPDEKYRAIGTIINNSLDVSIENHLIICLPKDGTLNKCEKLLTHLRDKKTNDWLNKRIRCRHLTTSSIKETPWI